MTITVIADSDDVTVNYNTERFAILPRGVRDIGTGNNYALAFQGGGSLTVEGELYGEVGALVARITAFDVIVGETGIIGGLDRRNLSSEGIEITVNGSTVTNAGEIFGNTGIETPAGVSGTRIANSGEINGYAEAVLMGAGHLANTGTLRSLTADGLRAQGDLTLVNHGLIEGIADGVDAFSSDLQKVENHGTIQGGSGNGLRLTSSQENVNHGTIEGHIGVDIASYDSNTILFNYGTIIGRGGEAIDADADADDVFNNAGTVVGYVDMEGGSDVVRNGGSIGGDLLLGSGDNRYLANGQAEVWGNVTSGAGADVIRQNGHVWENVEMGGGADSYTSRKGVIDGNWRGEAGADLYDGRGDTHVLGEIDGGIGNDTIIGGRNDDVILGGNHDDVLLGKAGDDRFLGGGGADLIRGGAGDDTISSGEGADTMAGGAGEDVFVFASVADIGLTGANRDTVLDFTTLIDLIDLSGVDANTTAAGDQAFIWIDGAGFSNTAGELRYSGINGHLAGDVDGDGAADFKLVLANREAIVAEDMIL